MYNDITDMLRTDVYCLLEAPPVWKEDQIPFEGIAHENEFTD